MNISENLNFIFKFYDLNLSQIQIEYASFILVSICEFRFCYIYFCNSQWAYKNYH